MAGGRRSRWFRGGGAPRRGWYGHYWCDSSWELAFLLWCLDRGREVVRPTENFRYPYRGGFRYYRPDFIVDGRWVEIKGVMDGRSKRKLENFPYPITVIRAEEIGPYLEYARMKYGEDFDRLLQVPDA